MQRIESKKILQFIVLVLPMVSIASITLAAYQPGATLDPQCTPTQTDCDVATIQNTTAPVTVSAPMTISSATISALTVSGDTTMTGSVQITGDITPTAGTTSASLGSATVPWRDLYVSADSINIAGYTLSLNSSNQLVWNGLGGLLISDTSSNNIFSGNLTVGDNALRVNASGKKVSIGSSTQYGQLTIKEDSVISDDSHGLTFLSNTGSHWTINTGGSSRLMYLYNGSVVNYMSTNGNWFTTSDRNLKKDITGLPYGLDQVLRMRPVSFNFKTDSSSTPKTLGFIAQDIQGLVPEAVQEENSIKLLNTNSLIPVIVKAVQEQQTEINDVKSSTLSGNDEILSGETFKIINFNKPFSSTPVVVASPLGLYPDVTFGITKVDAKGFTLSISSNKMLSNDFNFSWIATLK